MRRTIFGLFMLAANPFVVAVIVLTSGFYVLAQPAAPTDPVYWCNISRSQVSQERDFSLAQIEVLKARNTAMEARIKELEAAVKAQE